MVWFSILINGSPSNFFNSSHGVRHGDLLLPLLFVIIEFNNYTNTLHQEFDTYYISKVIICYVYEIG
jgi:hypothetical protein